MSGKIKKAYKSSSSIYDEVLTANKWWSKLYNNIFWGGLDDVKLANKLLSYIPDDFKGVLLDVPVGTAVFTHKKYKRLKKAKIIALDYSKDMLTNANEKLWEVKNVKLVRGDVGNLPYKNNTFDIVLSMNGFHAFPDKEAAFLETYRVLKKGGKFIGCFYIKGENILTDALVNYLFARMGWFTKPFDTFNSLRSKLLTMYEKVYIRKEGSIAYFICRG